ncbi:hypothetical protein MAPG_09308 [Magnaporthiopsis poae ATCC 64411]|uniref:Uncharacterized protein n=1 Tax=Magnaporthiopsis poae (strain ATCC 64411 / 73-15) TaxID=644358 RepID=A0A0C4E9L3_MAGP6|nr:hypothetical protein MAPG_09308 [Magnaporthiopsis poae ATCC 64411]
MVIGRGEGAILVESSSVGVVVLGSVLEQGLSCYSSLSLASVGMGRVRGPRAINCRRARRNKPKKRQGGSGMRKTQGAARKIPFRWLEDMEDQDGGRCPRTVGLSSPPDDACKTMQLFYCFPHLEVADGPVYKHAGVVVFATRQQEQPSSYSRGIMKPESDRTAGQVTRTPDVLLILHDWKHAAAELGEPQLARLVRFGLLDNEDASCSAPCHVTSPRAAVFPRCRGALANQHSTIAPQAPLPVVARHGLAHGGQGINISAAGCPALGESIKIRQQRFGGFRFDGSLRRCNPVDASPRLPFWGSSL